MHFLQFFLHLLHYEGFFSTVSISIYQKQARAGIQEVHFLPFNPTDKRTALTYIDGEGKMHRVSKGAPEQVFYLLVFLCPADSCFGCL